MATHASSPATELLRRSLDRAVIRGCAVRLAGIVGCFGACAAVLWWAVVAVGQVFGAGADLLAAAPVATRAGIAIGAGLVTAVIFRDAVFKGRWPTRLAVAIETERQNASLGERLSRAVAFLDEPVANDGESSADAALASGLRRLAIEQAAAALPGRLAVPGWPADGRWIGAGVLAGTAALVSAFVAPAPWGGAKQQGDAPSAVATVPAAGAAMNAGGAATSDAASAAVGRRLLAAAAAERRVAAAAATLFAAAPGTNRESLRRDAQARLDRLAAIQEEVCDAVRAVRAEIRGVAATSAGRAAGCLERLDVFAAVGGESIGGHVVANRLGLAADRAAAAADAIAAAAAAWTLDTGAAEPEEPFRDDPRLARAALVLDELAAVDVHAADDAARASSRGAAAPDAGAEAARAPAPPSSNAAGPVHEPDGSQAGGDGATTSPSPASTRQTAAGAADGRPRGMAAAPSAARQADGVWRPPVPRPPESAPASTAIPEDGPPAYRQAVAEYYRLVRPLPAPEGDATRSGRESPQR